MNVFIIIGEIPMALSDFQNLAGIYLFNNQFTSKIFYWYTYDTFINPMYFP